MKPTLSIILLLFISGFSLAKTSLLEAHGYSPEISREIASSIKVKLIQNISMISNQTLSQLLLADIFQDRNQKRKLKQIDMRSGAQIFKIFNLKMPKCDLNEDGIINGHQLKCFNKIWRYYIPGQDYYVPPIPS